LALFWEAGSSDTRIVIPGSSNPDHIMENTQLYDFELTDEEMEQIEALEKMRSMTGTKIEE